MYADETVLHISHSSLDIAITLLQSDLNSVYTWCNSNSRPANS